MRRITQREAIFYRLYKALHDTRGEFKRGDFLPVYALMGEIYCPEAGKWGYVSYECSARASELISENPRLFQRKKIEGRSGAKYFAYRMNPEPTIDMIVSEDLKKFHRMIRNAQPTKL